MKSCEIHSQTLIEGEAKYVHDGFRYTERAFLQASKQFPHANSYKLYGSPLRRTGAVIPKTIPVEYCEECRTPQRAWLMAHLPATASFLKYVILPLEEAKSLSFLIRIHARIFVPDAALLDQKSNAQDYKVLIGFMFSGTEALLHAKPNGKEELIHLESKKAHFVDISIIEYEDIVYGLKPKTRFQGYLPDESFLFHGEIIEVHVVHNELR